jgi:hypothetical protein
MDRMTERTPDRVYYGCHVPGNRGRPTAAERRARIEGIAEALAAEYGGLASLTAVERLLVMQAAELSLRKPRNCEDHVRIINSTQRALAKLGKRQKPNRRPLETYLEGNKRKGL